MCHILKIQLLILQRQSMKRNNVSFDDILISRGFKQIEKDWERKNLSINELHVIMRGFCQRHNYVELFENQ